MKASKLIPFLLLTTVFSNATYNNKHFKLLEGVEQTEPTTEIKLDKVTSFFESIFADEEKSASKVAHHNKSVKEYKKKGFSNYKEFKKHTNLRKSYSIFKDKELLGEANSENTALEIDISEQRLRLYVDSKVAIDSPCTTGAKRKFEPNTKTYRDKRTPKGNFQIQEKIVDKRSSIFGKYYRKGKLVYRGDKRKYRGSKKGLRYEGASLKNWMRLTGDGIGLHASKYVKRYPGSNGCIRLPKSVASTVFKKVKRGTKVSIES